MLAGNLQSRVKKGKMSEEKFEKIFSLVQGAVDYENFRDVDMVIEVSAALHSLPCCSLYTYK